MASDVDTYVREILDNSQYLAALDKAYAKEKALTTIRNMGGTVAVKAWKDTEKAARDSAKEQERQEKYLRDLRLRYNADQEQAAKKAMAEREAALGGILPGVTAALGGVVALTAGLSALADEIDTLGDVAARANLSTSIVEAFGQAAREGGAGLDEVAGSLQMFMRRTVEAASGTGTAADAFDKLGVSLKNSDGSLRSTEEVLKQTVARIASIPDPTQRAAAAVEVFGRGAGPILETGLLNTVGALDKAIERVDKLGISSVPTATKAAEDWQKQLGVLNLALDGSKAALVGFVGPWATERLQEFTLGLATVSEIGGLYLKSLQQQFEDTVRSVEIMAESRSWEELKGNLQRTQDLFDSHDMSDEFADANERLKALKESQKEVKEGTDALTTATAEYGIENKKNAKDAEKALEDQEKLELARLRAIEEANDRQLRYDDEIRDALQKKRQETYEKAVELQEKQAEVERERQLQAVEDAEKAEAAKQEAIQGTLDQMASATSAAFDLITQSQEQATNRAVDRVESLQEKYDEAIEAGDKGKAKALESQIESAEKGAIAAFEAQQKAATASAITQAALGVAVALASAPPPANLIPAGVAVLQGAAQVAAVKAVKPPEFDDTPEAMMARNMQPARAQVSLHRDDIFIAGKTPESVVNQAAGLAGGAGNWRRSFGPKLAQGTLTLLTRDVRRAARGRIRG